MLSVRRSSVRPSQTFVNMTFHKQFTEMSPNLYLGTNVNLLDFEVKRQRSRSFITRPNMASKALRRGLSCLCVKQCYYTLSQKTVQNCFCQNFIKCLPILVIFGRKMEKSIELCEVHSFSTSPNSRHHTTVLNADVLNCYTTR